jgi:hypothetical protein
MTLPAGRGDEPFEAGTSGGKALRIWSPATASATVTATRPIDHLFIRARGDECLEPAKISVRVDRVERYNGPLTKTYSDIGVRIALRAGTHDIDIEFLNDGSVWGVGDDEPICDRNALIDYVTLVASPFSSSGWRNQPLPDATAVDADSADMVADLQRQIKEGADDLTRPGTWVSTGATATIYTVGPGQPKVKVTHTGNDASLQAQWNEVPLPDDAKPSNPPWDPKTKQWGDANLVVWQPSTDTIWEFFHLRRSDEPPRPGQDPLKPVWLADYGGRMQNVSAHEGQFENPPGTQFGSSATSIAQLATLARVEEVRRGVAEQKAGVGLGTLDRAIGVTVTGTQGYDGWCWPAHRTDPQHWRRTSAAIPAGTRFRLPHDFDWAGWLAAHPMTRYGLMVARTVQKYGMVVSDSGQGVGFGVEDPAPTGSDPFYANGLPRGDGPFEGQWPDEGGVLKNFPWGSLVALAQPSGTGFGCQNDPDVKAPNDN